jgi:AP-3 complex subunit delta
MDLFSDLLPMLNHSKGYVRKKSVLVMYKIFLQYPDALRVAFPRLREKLDDEDICMS